MSDDATARARAAAALAALKARYRGEAAALCDRFAELGAQLAADPGNARAIGELARTVHRVHGTAGSLGFDAASARSAALEALVEGWRGTEGPDRAARGGIVVEFARALRADFGIDGGAPPE
ncbi:MAG: Hpt domain-containing protein [Gemmatimonadetes bacterium]|nr:Hpt domain-containing protein [Gemmatimonadota bacterium]